MSGVQVVCMKCFNPHPPNAEHGEEDCKRLIYLQAKLDAERKKTELHLDEYEITNLRACLEVIAATPAVSAMNTGDWVNQIRFKLPETKLGPNVSSKSQAQALGLRVQKVIKDFLADPNSDPAALRRLLAEYKQ